MRKAYSIFYDNAEVTYEELGDGAVAITFDDGKGGKALAIVNPSMGNLSYGLEGEWNLIVTSDTAGSAVLARESGTVAVDSIGVRIYVNDALLK